jgi:four helix bundle protein
VYALIASGPASSDFKFRDQIRDAAASATRNIREGFGRFHPHDFARFMDYAIASTMEVQDCLDDGVDRGHFTSNKTIKAGRLAVRSLQISKGLKRYLLSCRRHPFRPPDERSAKPREQSAKPPERSANPARTIAEPARTIGEAPRTFMIS